MNTKELIRKLEQMTELSESRNEFYKKLIHSFQNDADPQIYDKIYSNLCGLLAHGDLNNKEYEDYYLIGTDDKGNQGLYRMTNYGDTETVFEESRNNTKYKGISPDAKTVTLELYVNKEEKNRTTYKKYEAGTEDTYGEGVGRVYESDEDPLDLYSLVEGKIEIKLR